MLDLPLVWRGEHGPDRLSTRLATLTFVEDRVAAEHYARQPNRRQDQALQPTLIQARLAITRPIVNTPDDPFLDFPVLAEQVGHDRALGIFLRHQADVMHTNAWADVAQQGFSSVEDLVARAPELLDHLCVQIFPLLDEAQTVAQLREAGFDGAIHRGSGVTMDTVEYRVFAPTQVTVTQILPLTGFPARQRRPGLA